VKKAVIRQQRHVGHADGTHGMVIRKGPGHPGLGRDLSGASVDRQAAPLSAMGKQDLNLGLYMRWIQCLQSCLAPSGAPCLR